MCHSVNISWTFDLLPNTGQWSSPESVDRDGCDCVWPHQSAEWFWAASTVASPVPNCAIPNGTCTWPPPAAGGCRAPDQSCKFVWF